MTSNNSNSSDVGFIVLISFAVLALIPLTIGFDSFEKLFRVGKIILIVILVVAVVMGALFGYIFYKRKIGKRNVGKEKKLRESISTEKQEEPKEKCSKEIENIDSIFDESDEVRHPEKRKQMS